MADVFALWKKVWRQYFSRSFFRKIFWAYLSITVLTGLILFLVFSGNLISGRYEQAQVMSDQILTTVDAFLKTKMENAVSIYQRLYAEREIRESILQEAGQAEENGLYAFQQQEIRQSVANIIYGIDRDFNGLFLGNYESGKIWMFGNGDMTVETGFFSEQLQKRGTGQHQSALVSSRNEKSPGNAFSLFWMGTIKDESYSRDIGCIGLYFNAINIKQSYKEYEEYLKGRLYVFNQEGELLFDSTARYELPEGMETETLLAQEKGRGLGKWICNALHAEESGYVIVNVYTLGDVWPDILGSLLSMIFIFAAALVIAVLLNYVSSRLFVRRLQPITDVIEQVKNGHLTSFPIQKTYDDEIGFIYTELLRMCVSLDDHIQKEYVYRLRQKEMELYALQAQVDPHFLYNTLEAIRMKLYVKGEDEASRMIRILSELFRNMMKKDAVITNREELKYLHSYLELFQFRLGSRMQFVFRVEEEVYRYATIKYILQPIVENALVHGIEEMGTIEKPCTICISGKKEGEDILFTVSDDGCGISEEKLAEIRRRLESDEMFQKSIGIYNVSSRLRIVYGPAYRLRIDSREGKGTTVTVRVKAMRKRELEEYVQTVDR